MEEKKTEPGPQAAIPPAVNVDMHDVGYRSAKAYLDAISRSDPKFVEGFMKAMREAIEAKK